jgi:hypothetical protein
MHGRTGSGGNSYNSRKHDHVVEQQMSVILVALLQVLLCVVCCSTCEHGA